MKHPEYFASKYPTTWRSQNWQHVCRWGKNNLHIIHKCPCNVHESEIMLWFLFSYWSDYSPIWLSKHRPTHLPDQVSLFAFEIWSWGDLLNWYNNIPLKNPLIVPLNNPVFVLCFCSAAWLRGPERAKLANSLEDLYVWVLLLISDFTRRYCGVLLATTRSFSDEQFSLSAVYVSYKIESHMEIFKLLTGSMQGRASSTCGWKKLENSWWRNPRAQKQVRREKLNSCLRATLLWAICNHLKWHLIVNFSM